MPRGPPKLPALGLHTRTLRDSKTQKHLLMAYTQLSVCPPDLGQGPGPVWIPQHLPGSCGMQAGLTASWSRDAGQQGTLSLVSELQMGHRTELSTLLRKALD